MRAVYVHRRERSKVPYIVRQCIEEVEKRGIDEVGIYRISGVATDIQALKTAFDTSKTPLTVSMSDTLFLPSPCLENSLALWCTNRLLYIKQKHV